MNNSERWGFVAHVAVFGQKRARISRATQPTIRNWVFCLPTGTTTYSIRYALTKVLSYHLTYDGVCPRVSFVQRWDVIEGVGIADDK